ncbi:helix-turn-helix domain-containing protein [Nocardia sp. alder85J]|uniref:helix-turn-helix domain-containing protein n=1 Tax=Nocardia sp. alder85J TaxID=2862949 RepID=UPI001CD6EF5C|nr:helix-turn-helix domain-containing protein [Nocardia sp. alder85J]MCX4099253.1 helix-turn-helix domain-containing protein [Nocardia sp. alder85J]
MQADSSLPIGQRIKKHRERIGMSQPVLGGLIGKSKEWVKAVENGRLKEPKLPVLVQIAQALGLRDLADLTGDGYAVSVSMFAGERHAALGLVQEALTEFRLTPPDHQTSVGHLAERLRTAWDVRHRSPDHRTQLGILLPDLLRDAQAAARARGDDRRTARKILAGTYQLADFYLAYQPSPELVWLVADRGMSEGIESDDPYVIACSAWAMVQALRDAGRWDEAISLARDAADRIVPYIERDSTADDWRGIVGALEAEIAYVHARTGRHGEAWAAWERADRYADRLGPAYRHVQTSFSRPVMQAHAVTLGVELQRPGEALAAANKFDADEIVSVPRRARHMIEVARAHAERKQSTAVLALLDKSERTASETIRYNGFAKSMIRELQARPPSGMREDVADLARRVGVAA